MSLIETAKATVTKRKSRREVIDPEVLELALSWAREEVGISQCAVAMKLTPSHTLARFHSVLTKDIRARLLVERGTDHTKEELRKTIYPDRI